MKLAHRWAAASLTGGKWSLVTSILGQFEPDELCRSEIRAKRFRLLSVWLLRGFKAGRMTDEVPEGRIQGERASFLTTAPTARGRSAKFEIAYGCNWAQGGVALLSSTIPNSARSARSRLRHPGRNKPYSR
jgi:hypothetical protein